MFEKARKRNWTVTIEKIDGKVESWHIYGMAQDAAVKAVMADEQVKNSYHFEFKDGIHKPEKEGK
jgi:hypothetical protein